VKRIAVIGAGGAGKTRLARALGQALDLPVVHLDAHTTARADSRSRLPSGRDGSASSPPPNAGDAQRHLEVPPALSPPKSSQTSPKLCRGPVQGKVIGGKL
jgi:hypothetical protein